MDPSIVTALITAGAGIISAIIGARAIIQKEKKKNKELSGKISELYSNGIRIPMLTPQQYGIDIVVPTEYTKAGHTFNVDGIYKALPDGHHIWTSTFRVDQEGDIVEYWPQGEAKAKNGKWHGKISNIGGQSGETKQFLVLVVGNDGNVLFKHFGKVGSMTGNWTGISKLTSDTVRCLNWSIKI